MSEMTVIKEEKETVRAPTFYQFSTHLKKTKKTQVTLSIILNEKDLSKEVTTLTNLL